MKAAKLLREDHDFVLRALGVIDVLVARSETANELNEADFECMLLVLRVFGDDHHQEKEEDILFPALREATHTDERETLSQIMSEHRQQRSHLEAMEEALYSHRCEDLVFSAKRLGEMMRWHIQSEESRVLKQTETVLSLEDDERIAHELVAYDSHYRAERIRAVLRYLIPMELKYRMHPSAPIEIQHSA